MRCGAVSIEAVLIGGVFDSRRARARAQSGRSERDRAEKREEGKEGEREVDLHTQFGLGWSWQHRDNPRQVDCKSAVAIHLRRFLCFVPLDLRKKTELSLKTTLVSAHHPKRGNWEAREDGGSNARQSQVRRRVVLWTLCTPTHPCYDLGGDVS